MLLMYIFHFWFFFFLYLLFLTELWIQVFVKQLLAVKCGHIQYSRVGVGGSSKGKGDQEEK